MPSSDGHPEYDANLLSTAPAPTKGMVQSGYATDLLEDKPNPSKPDDLEAGRHTSLLRPNRAKPIAHGMEPKEPFIRTKLSPSTEKQPFYRTTKGIVILIVVAVVILAAIIGGAVGGTLAKKNKSAASPQLVSAGDPVHSTSGSGDVGPQAGVPDSSSQGGGLVTVRVTTTLDPSTPSQVVTVRVTTTPEPSPRISSSPSSVLGGIGISP